MKERWSWPNYWKDTGDIDPDENKRSKLASEFFPKSALSCFYKIGIIIGLGH